MGNVLLFWQCCAVLVWIQESQDEVAGDRKPFQYEIEQMRRLEEGSQTELLGLHVSSKQRSVGPMPINCQFQYIAEFIPLMTFISLLC